MSHRYPFGFSQQPHDQRGDLLVCPLPSFPPTPTPTPTKNQGILCFSASFPGQPRKLSGYIWIHGRKFPNKLCARKNNMVPTKGKEPEIASQALQRWLSQWKGVEAES